MKSWIEGTKNYQALSIEDQVRFTSTAVEILTGIEAALESAKTDGIKQESVAAVKVMVHQLMRNKGVREYWLISGRNLFAQDFVVVVDEILKTASTADPKDVGPLPFYMPVPSSIGD